MFVFIKHQSGAHTVPLDTFPREIYYLRTNHHDMISLMANKQPLNSFFKRLNASVRTRHLPENFKLLALATSVGLATGIAVWLFRLLIEFFEITLDDLAARALLGPVLGPSAIVLVLALSGLIVGLLIDRFVGDEKHHGVAGILESVAATGGQLRYTVMPFKAAAAALSLGAGASVGPEDPSVQIGANLGSFFGQQMRLSEAKLRVLVAAGTASAISAAFNAPVAGVFFALEVILGELSTTSIGVVVLSAVMSSAFTQGVEVGEPELGRLTYELGSPLEIPLYIPLGMILVPFAVLFIRSVYFQHDWWHRNIKLPRPLRTALAGALVGGAGIFLPQILGTGRESMRAILGGEAQFAISLLILLAVAKLVFTGLSLAGGFQGGVFAPSLFIGTMLGAAFGEVVNMFVPARFAGDPQAFAIAGMAGMLAGVMQAPITAIILVFELTNDYRLILPIMFTTVVCTYLTEQIEPNNIYEYGLLRKGIRLNRGQDVDIMHGISVGEVMRQPAPTIYQGDSLLSLRNRLRAEHTHALCVVDEVGHLVGIVTLTDLQYAFSDLEHREAYSVGDICTHDVVTTEPDVVLASVIDEMNKYDVASLPVIRPMTGRAVGIVTRSGIMRAYRIAISQKMEMHYRIEKIRLDTLTGAHTHELLVMPESPIERKQLKEVEWPVDCVVATIHRDGRIIVPHGDTRIIPGDRVTLVADTVSGATFEPLFNASANIEDEP